MGEGQGIEHGQIIVTTFCHDKSQGKTERAAISVASASRALLASSAPRKSEYYLIVALKIRNYL